MISLRTWGYDNNPAGASIFVSIPVPVGTSDGHVAIVGVTRPTGVTVATPEGWTRIINTDAAAFGITVFWQVVLNPPARWVFELSSSEVAVGVALVYDGADSFDLVEASAFAITDTLGITDVDVPAVTTSDPSEELVLFLANVDGDGFIPDPGYTEPAEKTNTTTTLAAHRREVSVPGLVAAHTVTTSSSLSYAASVAIVLRPGVGKTSLADARRQIIAELPAKVEEVYDLTPDGDYYKMFQSVAEVLKTFGHDAVDLLRAERIPSKTRYKLPDWERIFGLTTTRTTKTSTLPQRRAQVQSSWRAAAGQGSTIPEIQAVIAPLLGYSDPADLLVVEASRDGLDLVNSYGPVADVDLPVGTTTIYLSVAHDGGIVSTGGARLKMLFADADLTDYTFTLTGPDGTTKTWSDGWDVTPLYLYGAEFVGKRVQGLWRLAVVNGAVGSNTMLSGAILFVEGVQPDYTTGPQQDTAAAIFEFGVYADPAHLGENGTPADLDAARAAVRKMRQAHTNVVLLQSLDPYPDEDSGVHAAIPDECIPT